jgi:hypothetical protein
MQLPKILPISWSISDDRNRQAAVPLFFQKGVARPSEPGDSISNNSDSSNVRSTNSSTSSNNQTCLECLAREITNWLPPPSEPHQTSPCTPCLRGFSLNSSNVRSTNSSNNKNTWNLQLLESFFDSISLPTTPIQLNPHTTIHNLSKFISTHIAICKRYQGNREFLPYLHRLQSLERILTQST